MNENDPKNIIVWLDFSAYAYINFGVISELNKLNKFNFIGIVSSKSDLDFFKNQKIISFKKLIYFPECYNNQSSYNIENLKLMEKKYELDLWQNIFSERYFYKYWKNFHKYSKNEILTITEKILIFLDQVVEKYEPELIIMQQAGENIANLLLYKIAKYSDTKILMPTLVHMQNRIAISEDLASREISNKFLEKKDEKSTEKQIYDYNYINTKNEGTLKTVFKYQYQTNFGQKIKHYFKRIRNEPESVYQNSGKTRYNMFKHRIRKFFAIKKLESFLDKNAIKSIENEKFFYFPLASEPEARILASSTYYSNQISLIENIAKAIPIDTVLYVKEHPVQKIKLWRTMNEYQKILALPNVKLVHPNTQSEELLKMCQGIISISGGTGFEGLFYQKPVFLFSDEFYDVLSTVTKIEILSKLPEYIENTLSNFKFENQEFNKFMESFNEETIPIPYHSMIKDGNMISSIQMYDNDYKLTLKHINKFFDVHKNDFQLMAKKIFEKIQK